MDKLMEAKQEIVNLFGFSDHLVAVNDAVITLDAKQLIAYRLTVDETATPGQWLEAVKTLNKCESYLYLTEILKGEGK
jgi:hypothetical protein